MVLALGVIILALHAIAPGDAAQQQAVFVDQAQGNAVYFEFGDVLQRLVGAVPFEHGPQNFGVRLPNSVVQTQHGHIVLHGLELLRQIRRHALRGRIGLDQIRCRASKSINSRLRSS